jgi:hypothetical protein
MLKGALHTHTTCSDGVLSPEELLRAYRELGIDFVALTDHDFLLKPDAYAEIPDVFEGMIVFKGVEKTVFARGYLHVNQIFGDREILHIFNHPAEYALTVEQVIDRVDEIERRMPIHAVEVTVKGYYTPEYDVAALPHPKVATDDAHTLEGCGRAWVEVSCAKNKDTLLRAIKHGDARICYTRTAHVSTWANQGGARGG